MRVSGEFGEKEAAFQGSACTSSPKPELQLQLLPVAHIQVGWIPLFSHQNEDRLHSSFQTFNTRALECLKPHERASSHSQKDHTRVPGRHSVMVGGDQLVDFLNTVCTWGWTQRLFPTHCGLLRPTEHRQHVT